MKNILWVIVFTAIVTSAQARPQQTSPLGLFQRLIKIKYAAELYLITAQKNQNKTSASKGEKFPIEKDEKQLFEKDIKSNIESLDSTLAIYNTIRWNVDGLVYQLSGDLVAANSPKKLRKLNEWCLKQNFNGESIDGNTKALGCIVSIEAETLKNIERLCQEYLPALSPIGKTAGDQIQNKNINLTTNVFYLIKDSYSLIKGLSDLKTQKTTALVEILDQMRLTNPQELLKQIK